MSQTAEAIPWVQLIIQAPALGAVWLFYSELKAFRAELSTFRVQLESVNDRMIEILSDSLSFRKAP